MAPNQQPYLESIPGQIDILVGSNISTDELAFTWTSPPVMEKENNVIKVDFYGNATDLKYLSISDLDDHNRFTVSLTKALNM